MNSSQQTIRVGLFFILGLALAWITFESLSGGKIFKKEGYTLVAPLEHRTDVVGSFTEAEYVELQRRVHRIGRALSAAVPTERLYVLSIGSRQGNAHVHWHLGPLPPGVPYREQQYAALMHEHGHLDVPEADLVALARNVARGVERG